MENHLVPNMNYKPLKNHFVKLAPRAEELLDTGDGAVLIPGPDSKIFLHWLNENGKLVSTFTMTYATKVQNKIKMINGSSKPVTVHVIEL